MKDEDYRILIQEINSQLQKSKLLIQELKTPLFDFVFKEMESDNIEKVNGVLNNHTVIFFPQSVDQSDKLIFKDSLLMDQEYDMRSLNCESRDQQLNSLQGYQQMQYNYSQQTQNECQQSNIQKQALNRKKSIPSISEAQEVDEEEDQSKSPCSFINENQFFYYCQQQKKMSAISQAYQNQTEQISSILSEKYIQQPNELSLEIDRALTQLDNASPYNQSSQLDSKMVKSQEKTKQMLKRYLSTAASDSLFDGDAVELSMNLAETDNYQQLETNKEKTFTLDSTQQTKQLIQITSNSNLQTFQQSSPYLFQIKTFDESSNDGESLESNQQSQQSSTVFEIQNTDLVNNLFGSDTQMAKQQPYKPSNINDAIINVDNVFDPFYQKDMQDILSPLFTKQVFIDELNLESSEQSTQYQNKKTQYEESQNGNKMMIQEESNDTKMEELEKELQQINTKIASLSRPNSLYSLTLLPQNSTKQTSNNHSKSNSNIQMAQNVHSPHLTNQKYLCPPQDNLKAMRQKLSFDASSKSPLTLNKNTFASKRLSINLQSQNPISSPSQISEQTQRKFTQKRGSLQYNIISNISSPSGLYNPLLTDRSNGNKSIKNLEEKQLILQQKLNQQDKSIA